MRYEFNPTENHLLEIIHIDDTGQVIETETIGKDIELLNVTQDTDTGVMQMNLRVYTSADKYIDVTENRDTVLNRPTVLTKYGADCVGSKKQTLFAEYIHLQEDGYAEKLYTHSLLGWHNNHYQAYYSTEHNLNSTYSGKMDISPHGCFDVWRDMVISCVLPYIPLQLGVILGLSAVVNGYMQDSLSESILCHIYGNSSTGKSTLLYLALSCACNPFSKNALMTRWDSTQNAIIGSLADNNGVVFGIDELSSNAHRDLSSLIYSLANGEEKLRMDSSSTLKDKRTWHTTIISNGEQSLSSFCSNNQGIGVRLFELNLPKITPNAEVAERIRVCLTNNYGFASFMLAEYIERIGRNEVESLFDSCRDEMLKKLHQKGIERAERISLKLAAIMLTAKLAENALDVAFEVDGIMSIVLDSVESNSSEPMVEQVMNAICADIVVHPNRYRREKRVVHSSEFYGELKKLKDSDKFNYELIYYPKMFRKFLAENGFADDRVVLNELQKHGFLSTDKDKRLSRKRSVNGIPMRVYVIYLTLDDDVKSAKKRLKIPTDDSLLSDDELDMDVTDCAKGA